MDASAAGWSARRVERFDQNITPVLPKCGLVSGTVCYRDAEVLNYFLLCPAARMEGYLLEHAGQVSGYFVLANVRGECKIAELWVASAEERDWASAIAVASDGRGASQTSVACGAAVARQAAALAGFHVVTRQPVYVKDPKGKLPGTLDAAMGLLDWDGFYL